MSDTLVDLVALQSQREAVDAESVELEKRIASAIKALKAEQAEAIAVLEDSFSGERAAIAEQLEAITAEMMKHPAVQMATQAKLAERSARRLRSRHTSARDVLEFIVENEPCGYSDIADNFEVTVQTVRGRVDLLIAQKLVIKKENPNNKRAVLLESVEDALSLFVDDEE